jgi:hypothetical protein
LAEGRHCDRQDWTADAVSHHEYPGAGEPPVVRLNDIAKENVTLGEMETVHEDLTRFRLEIDSLVTRVEQLEERNRDH